MAQTPAFSPKPVQKSISAKRVLGKSGCPLSFWPVVQNKHNFRFGWVVERLKFDVVVGNVVPIFDKREWYERFKRDMQYVGRLVRFMEPEEWVAVFSNYPQIGLYAEIKYAVAYDPKHFIYQINYIIGNIEKGVRTVNDDTELLVLLSKQIIALSEKVDSLSDAVSNIDAQISCDEDYLAEQIAEHMPDLPIDCEALAEQIAEQLKQGYIEDISELLQEKYKLANKHRQSR